MVLSGDKKIRKIYAMAVICLILFSSITIEVKSTSHIDWGDDNSIRNSFMQDPQGTIRENPEKAKEFVRKNPEVVLNNPEAGKAYFSELGPITDPRDREIAQKFLSKNTRKNFDLSKGTLQIKDERIFDEKGQAFDINQIRAMTNVIMVESLEGGGLRFYYKDNNLVDVAQAKSLGQNGENIVIDGKEISLVGENQNIAIKSGDDVFEASCKSSGCAFKKSGFDVNLKNNGLYRETGDFIKIQNAVFSAGNDRLYGDAEFYRSLAGIDKTKPITSLGEKSSVFVDGQWHRATPINLKYGKDFTNGLKDSISGNKEFIDGIADSDSFSKTKICIQCAPQSLAQLERELAQGEISGFVFGLRNPVSEKQTMINGGEVISKYDNAVVIGVHTATEYRTQINQKNVIVDGPHNDKGLGYIGSVIANGGKLDHFNIDGKTVTMQDRLYNFGNIPSSRFFFPESISQNVKELLPLSNFAKASELNPSSNSGIVAINRLFGGSGNIESIPDEELKSAYADFASILDNDKNPKHVANLNDAFIESQKVTNLYLFKANGELNLPQSGENHELFKDIMKEQFRESYFLQRVNNPALNDKPESLRQMERLYDFMIWKNVEMHKDAARYEELTNIWGYIPLNKFNPYLRGVGYFTSDDERLFDSIVENDRAQEGAQRILRQAEQGKTFSQIREEFFPGKDPLIDAAFEDPGINALYRIESLSKEISDPKILGQEKAKVQQQAADKYKELNAPEQALLMSMEFFREKYGQSDVYGNIIQNRLQLCDPSTSCGELFQQISPNQVRSAPNKIVLGDRVFAYPEGWSQEMVSDVENLYRLQRQIWTDENRQKFREIAESFFDAEQIAAGFTLSVATGGTSAVVGKFGYLIQNARSPITKATLEAGRAGALFNEWVFVGDFGLLSSAPAMKAAETAGTAVREYGVLARVGRETVPIDIGKVKDWPELEDYIRAEVNLRNPLVEDFGDGVRIYQRDELLGIVNGVKDGSRGIEEVPRSLGVRNKVVDILENRELPDHVSLVEYSPSGEDVYRITDGSKIDVSRPNIWDHPAIPEKITIDFENDPMLRKTYEEDIMPKARDILNRHPNIALSSATRAEVIAYENEVLQHVHYYTQVSVPYSREYSLRIMEVAEGRNVLVGESCLFVGGVCRQQAMLEAAYVAKLADDGFLSGWPTINTGPGHAWAEYLRPSESGRQLRIVLDPAQEKIGELGKLADAGRDKFAGTLRKGKQEFKYQDSYPWGSIEAHYDYYSSGNAEAVPVLSGIGRSAAFETFTKNDFGVSLYDGNVPPNTLVRSAERDEIKIIEFVKGKPGDNPIYRVEVNGVETEMSPAGIFDSVFSRGSNTQEISVVFDSQEKLDEFRKTVIKD